jgi:hypothetical protein
MHYRLSDFGDYGKSTQLHSNLQLCNCLTIIGECIVAIIDINDGSKEPSCGYLKVRISLYTQDR